MIIRVNVVFSLTLMMTKAQVVETSVTINKNSPIYNYAHPDDLVSPIYLFIFLLNVLTICLLYMYPLKQIPNNYVILCQLEIHLCTYLLQRPNYYSHI